jgi:hypothetical protein
MICSSVCLLRFIVWSFLKARLQFTLDQIKGATSLENGCGDNGLSLLNVASQHEAQNVNQA